MNKKILEEYKKKIKIINKYNKFYYDKSEPIVLDNEYDVLKRDIIKLENTYPYLNSKQSPSKVIGHKPSKISRKKIIESQCFLLQMLSQKRIF